MSKRKHDKNLSSFGFKKKATKKVSSERFFLEEASLYILVYINSVSCNYKKLRGRTQNPKK